MQISCQLQLKWNNKPEKIQAGGQQTNNIAS